VGMNEGRYYKEAIVDHLEFHQQILREYGEEIQFHIDNVQARAREPVDQSGSTLNIEVAGHVVMELSTEQKGAAYVPLVVSRPGKTSFVIEVDHIRPLRKSEESIVPFIPPVIKEEYLPLEIARDMHLQAFSEADQKTVRDILKAVVEADGDGLLKRLDRKDLPILFIDEHALLRDHVARLLRTADLPIIVVSTKDELNAELRDRGMSERDIREKLTGLTHPMRSDAELSGLAEVVRAMPAFKVNNPGKSSRRPALPKNRKRDRWN
jgi:hypothetical protein